MVDDDGRRQRGEEIPELRQVDRLEIDHDMPAELRDAPGDLHELVLGVKSTRRLTKLKRTPRTPAAWRLLQLFVARRCAGPSRRRAPCRRSQDRRRPSRDCRRRDRSPARSRCARSRDGRAARRAELARVAGRVFALGRVRKFRAGAEHVAMRVDRARRRHEARLRSDRRTSRASPWSSRTARWSAVRSVSQRSSGPQSIYLRPALSSGSRILYMSRPSTPDASFARLSPSLASRACRRLDGLWRPRRQARRPRRRRRRR